MKDEEGDWGIGEYTNNSVMVLIVKYKDEGLRK